MMSHADKSTKSPRGSRLDKAAVLTFLTLPTPLDRGAVRLAFKIWFETQKLEV